ncbi:MAG: acyl-CoA dehydrogenase family protein [Dehalococcoidia bacterium]|nr:acyl-CoA dehydrogenase family protein [Dehalococcoidia bacterium]
MDFELTEEQKMLKTNVRDFLEKEIVPIVDEHDRRGPMTREEAVGFIKQLMPFGYYIGQLPEEYGGSSLDNKTYCILMEELGRAWASLAGVIMIAAIGPDILQMGPEELKKKLLPRAMAGELIGCGAITEPNAGSDAASIETTAVAEGNKWVINGTKTWISNGSIADVVMLLCVTDRSKGPLGISRILVEKESSPFSARELHKLGLRAFPTSELSFIDCRVPKENLLGDPSLGYKQMMVGFESARATLAAISTGIAQAAIDAAIKYAQERKQFGRPIGSFQMIQEMIVDMIAETEAMRLLTYRAFDLIDKGERCRWQSSLAKAYATEMAVNVASKAIQIHGAMGLSDDYPVERYFRDARTMTIPDGATQIQKLVVGREVIGIRAFV